MWLSLIIHKKPYKSGWDNFIAIILAAHLLFTLVSGMALKLYASTPDQDAYQRAGFGIVLVFVSVVCVLLGICSIIASTPCLRDTVMRRLNGVVKSGGKKNNANEEGSRNGGELNNRKKWDAMYCAKWR